MFSHKIHLSHAISPPAETVLICFLLGYVSWLLLAACRLLLSPEHPHAQPTEQKTIRMLFGTMAHRATNHRNECAIGVVRIDDAAAAIVFHINDI